MPLIQEQENLIQRVARQIYEGRASDPIDLTPLLPGFHLNQQEILKMLAKHIEELSAGEWTVRSANPDFFVNRVRGAALYVAFCSAGSHPDYVRELLSMPSSPARLMIIGPYDNGVMVENPLDIPA